MDTIHTIKTGNPSSSQSSSSSSPSSSARQRILNSNTVERTTVFFPTTNNNSVTSTMLNGERRNGEKERNQQEVMTNIETRRILDVQVKPSKEVVTVSSATNNNNNNNQALVKSSENQSHVVTIQITENNKNNLIKQLQKVQDEQQQVSVNSKNSNNHNNSRVSVINIKPSNDDNHQQNEMVQKSQNELDVSNPTYLYYGMQTSGQCSPRSDTLDSGTCSDLEVMPPPLPKKMLKTNAINKNNANINNTISTINKSTTTTIIRHSRNGSLTDSEESESSLSCDSLNLSDLSLMMNNNNNNNNNSIPTPPPMLPPIINNDMNMDQVLGLLPDSLLKDIRERSNKLSINNNNNQMNDVMGKGKTKVDIRTYIARNNNDDDEDLDDELDRLQNDEVDHFVINNSTGLNNKFFENDKFYKFHINENVNDLTGINFDKTTQPRKSIIEEDESFAGYKDIHSGTSTIRSNKGTIRGVKNRVRNGIATFLQYQHTNVKVCVFCLLDFRSRLNYALRGLFLKQMFYLYQLFLCFTYLTI